MVEGIIFTNVGKTIFNVYFKKTGTRKYYGSLKAIFDDNGKEAIGISKFTLDRYKDEDWKTPYDNENVTIERGEMLSTGDIKRK